MYSTPSLDEKIIHLYQGLIYDVEDFSESGMQDYLNKRADQVIINLGGKKFLSLDDYFILQQETRSEKKESSNPSSKFQDRWLLNQTFLLQKKITFRLERAERGKVHELRELGWWDKVSNKAGYTTLPSETEIKRLQERLQSIKKRSP